MRSGMICSSHESLVHSFVSGQNQNKCSSISLSSVHIHVFVCLAKSDYYSGDTCCGGVFPLNFWGDWLIQQCSCIYSSILCFLAGAVEAWLSVGTASVTHRGNCCLSILPDFSIYLEEVTFATDRNWNCASEIGKGYEMLGVHWR